MPKQSPIRYLAITAQDGDKFIIRVAREGTNGVCGIEVDREGEEIVPVGFHNRMRVVLHSAIKKAVEMRMNLTYGRIEKVAP